MSIEFIPLSSIPGRCVLKASQQRVVFCSCPQPPSCREATELWGGSWSSGPCCSLYMSTPGGLTEQQPTYPKWAICWRIILRILTRHLPRLGLQSFQFKSVFVVFRFLKKTHVDFRTETWLRCKHTHGNSNTKYSSGAYSQTQAFPPPLQVGLGSLSQELRVHLNHWPCLFSKVHSDYHLRTALVQQSRLLVEIKQTLDLLALQALVLVEHFVFVILSAVAQSELESVSREVLEDILAGTRLYNQAVWERAQHSTTQLRTTVLQQPHYSTLDSSLPNSKGHQPAAFSVKELTMILALHHADMIAKQLHCWASDQSCHICQVHPNYEAYTCSDSSVSQVARASCGNSVLRPEWTWKQLQHTYLSSSLFSIHHHPPSQSSHYACHKTPPVYVPDLQRDSAILLNHHPIFAKPTFVQRGAEASNNDQSSQCQTYMFQTGSAQTSGEALLSVRPLSALPLSGVCHQDHSSVELLFQQLVSPNDLLTPLVSHTPKRKAQTEQLLPNAINNASVPNRQTDIISTAPAINTADSVEMNQLSTELNQQRHVDGAQQEMAELEIKATLEATVR